MPSIVTSCAPSACIASMLQDFTARPFMWIVQAPHWAVSQPTWVPVSRRLLRMNSTRSVRSSTSAVAGLPFTVRDTRTVIQPPLRLHVRVLAGARQCAALAEWEGTDWQRFSPMAPAEATEARLAGPHRHHHL